VSTPRSIALPTGVRRVRFDDLGIAALRADGQSMGSILLAPGFTGSKEDFLALIAPMNAMGWTVVAIDHRGQYESDPRDEYSLDIWADDVCAVASTLPGPVRLVGHSLGGLIAGRAAARFDWAGVTLLNSGSGPIHQSQHDRLKLLIQALEHFTPEQIWQAKVAGDEANGIAAPPPEIMAFLHQRWLRTDPRGMAVMARILLDGPLQDLQGAHGRLLVAFGVEDADSWSWQAQVDLASRWKARLATIPGAAHSPAVEAPEATAALLSATFIEAGDPRCVRPRRSGYEVGMQIVTPLAADSAAIRRARKTVIDQLWAWGLSDIADDAEIITSELVTNAIAHGGGLIELRLSALDDRVRITVMDGNPHDVPKVAGDRGLEIGGRGMALVQALATDWGLEIGTESKQVWAELAA
jgi:pimeloyl-ACP methyl ester carboxylesterase/anti-sigma regulatory factor (Ser/Thr protein kinase)